MSVYISLNNKTRYESRWLGILWLASDVSLLGDAILEKRLLLLLSSGLRSEKTIVRFYLYPRDGGHRGTCHGYCHKVLDDVVEWMGCARCPRAQVRLDLTWVTLILRVEWHHLMETAREYTYSSDDVNGQRQGHEILCPWLACMHICPTRYIRFRTWSCGLKLHRPGTARASGSRQVASLSMWWSFFGR